MVLWWDWVLPIPLRISESNLDDSLFNEILRMGCLEGSLGELCPCLVERFQLNRNSLIRNNTETPI